MENLKFNFNHGVKGMVKLLNKLNPKQFRIIPLDTTCADCFEIPLENLPTGKWRALLEWEYEGRDFYLEEEFEVN